MSDRRLRPAELEFIALVAQSKTRKEIALRWGLSVKTVDGYAYRVRAKVGSCNPVVLTRLAVQRKLVEA
jgi:DNA-binding CsgD family transcriptional regulator